MGTAIVKVAPTPLADRPQKALKRAPDEAAELFRIRTGVHGLPAKQRGEFTPVLRDEATLKRRAAQKADGIAEFSGTLGSVVGSGLVTVSITSAATALSLSTVNVFLGVLGLVVLLGGTQVKMRARLRRDSLLANAQMLDDLSRSGTDG